MKIFVKQNPVNQWLSQKEFSRNPGKHVPCGYIFIFTMCFVIHQFTELIELCQSKVHRPCPIGIIHTFELLKGKFPEHRFHYANQFVERYWKTTTKFR